MALRIRKDGSSGRGGLVADRRLYRRADGTPCERGDPKAAFLLAGRGSEVPPEYVERYDMRLDDGRVVWGERQAEPAPEHSPDPPEQDEEGDEEAAAEPQKLGGGWWELPDGRKVRTSELPDPPDGEG